MDFAPHRPGKYDPEGCILAPVREAQVAFWKSGRAVLNEKVHTLENGYGGQRSRIEEENHLPNFFFGSMLVFQDVHFFLIGSLTLLNCFDQIHAVRCR